MGILSVRDYRNNLAASFDKAAEGEKVLIRRKNTIYSLVCIGTEELTLPPHQMRMLDEMAESIRRSWNQVKMMEAGELPSKSALDFIDEL